MKSSSVNDNLTEKSSWIFSQIWHWIARKNPNKSFSIKISLPDGFYLLKFNNKNTKTRLEICSKLTIKTLDQCMKYVQS